MAKSYEGNFDVRVNPTTNLVEFLVNRDGSGKYTAADAELALSNIIDYASANKLSLNRWDFYIPDVNQTIAKDDKALPLAKVLKAIKDGYVPTIGLGKWGKPKMTIASPVKHTVVKATAILI